MAPYTSSGPELHMKLTVACIKS